MMRIIEIHIHKIAGGYHPRKDRKGQEELKKQIQENGLKEPPERVRPDNDCL